MKTVTRNKRLDNTKWILTILMVLYHIGYVGHGGLDEKLFLYIKNLGDCVVPAFALISGFLFWKNVDSLEMVKKKMFKRIPMLLVPYIVWNCINTILANTFNVGLRNLNKNVFTINIIDNVLRWNSSPHFWYIFMLMFWTLLSPILFLAYKNKIILIILFLTQICYLVYKGNNILDSRVTYILFTWGGGIGFYKPLLPEKIYSWTIEKKKMITIISLAFYFAIGLATSFSDVGKQLRVWLYAIRAVFLILGLINLPLLFIGKITDYKFTFWLFIVHYWLDAYCGRFVSKFFNGIVYQFLTWFLVCCIGIFMGIICNYICPKFYKLLTGNR